jgi:hypothetical protein
MPSMHLSPSPIRFGFSYYLSLCIVICVLRPNFSKKSGHVLVASIRSCLLLLVQTLACISSTRLTCFAMSFVITQSAGERRNFPGCLHMNHISLEVPLLALLQAASRLVVLRYSFLSQASPAARCCSHSLLLQLSCFLQSLQGEEVVVEVEAEAEVQPIPRTPRRSVMPAT